MTLCERNSTCNKKRKEKKCREFEGKKRDKKYIQNHNGFLKIGNS